MNLVYLLFVLIYEMVSQDWPHEEKEQRLRKIEFIMLSAPRDRRYTEPCGKTPRWSGGRTGVLRLWPLLGFPRERQDRINSLELVGLNTFISLWE